LNQSAGVAAQATTAGSDLVIFDARRAPARSRAWARAHAAALSCAALLAVMSAQMFAVISRKSITADEIVLIPAAYYHLAAANCQLVHEHPPLVKLVAGVPLLFLQPNETNPEKWGGAPDTPPGQWT
jgi:GAF domain-containing protein